MPIKEHDAKNFSVGQNIAVTIFYFVFMGGGAALEWHAYDLIENHASENSPLWAMGYSFLGGYIILSGLMALNKQLNQLSDRR